VRIDIDPASFAPEDLRTHEELGGLDYVARRISSEEDDDE
jgi:hypothetical protein